MPDTPLRSAATVMLVRDAPDGPEVYLQRRVAGMAFAGGMTAFPGGGVDPQDAHPLRWAGPDPSWWADHLDTDERTAFTVVVAAVRELFEETGVLLGGGVADLASRQAVADRRIPLAELLGDRPLRSDLLRPWARWLTPAAQPRRYDTFFLLARVTDGVQPEMLTTESEIDEWWRPQDALDAAGRGELALLPPTVAMLQDLAEHASVDGMLAHTPVIRAVESVVVSSPGEQLRVRAGDREVTALGLPISRT